MFPIRLLILFIWDVRFLMGGYKLVPIYIYVRTCMQIQIYPRPLLTSNLFHKPKPEWEHRANIWVEEEGKKQKIPFPF